MTESTEEDPWEARIAKTGCYEENERLQLCRYDTGDWRQCLKEINAFKECWKRHENGLRVITVDIKQDDYNSDSKDINLTGRKHDQ